MTCARRVSFDTLRMRYFVRLLGDELMLIISTAAVINGCSELGMNATAGALREEFPCGAAAQNDKDEDTERREDEDGEDRPEKKRREIGFR